VEAERYIGSRDPPGKSIHKQFFVFLTYGAFITSNCFVCIVSLLGRRILMLNSFSFLNFGYPNHVFERITPIIYIFNKEFLITSLITRDSKQLEYK